MQYYQPYFTQDLDPREKWFEEDHAVNQSQTQTPGLKSAIAQLPFIDSNMSQKMSVHMVPKITGNQQNSDLLLSHFSWKSLVRPNFFFSLHHTSAAPLKIMDLFAYIREQDDHCAVQDVFYPCKDLANYYYLVTGVLVVC